MSTKDYYKLLGLEPSATEAEIKDAYRNLARQFHPDSGTKSSSEQTFQDINEAYQVLSDSSEKERYDLKCQMRGTLNQGLDINKTTRKQMRNNSQFGSVDFEDSKGEFGSKSGGDQGSGARAGLFSKLGNQLFSGKAPRENKSGKYDQGDAFKGERLYQFTVDALESLKGCSREVAVDHKDNPLIIPVTIPAGVCHGDILRISSPASESGGKMGTLKVKIIIVDHEVVRRDGSNIILKVPLSIGEALSGCEIDLPSLGSPIRVKIPAQTQTCKILRIKGKGVIGSGGKAGDLLVEPHVVLPDKVSEAIKAAGTAIDESYLRNIRKDLPRSF